MYITKMVPREIIISVLCIGLISAASIEFDVADDEIISEAEERTSELLNGKKATLIQKGEENDESNEWSEVRCYCNQPHCVSQGYMCRGSGCFTELPLTAKPPFSRLPDHIASYSGCLDKKLRPFKECPAAMLCCEQDLCNHVDNPAMRSRLNKTMQMLIGEQLYFESSNLPTGQAVPTTDNWFKTATIAVPICGFFALIILASFAIKLLQPLPSHDDKLHGLRIPDHAPPLLQQQKLLIV